MYLETGAAGAGERDVYAANRRRLQRAAQGERAFLRRTVEGCQRLTALDHDFNLYTSVQPQRHDRGYDQ